MTASLAKWDLIALLVRISKETEVKGQLRRDLRNVLREAARQGKASEKKLKLWRSKRKVREREEKKEAQRQRYELARQREELRRKWITRYGDTSIEVVCGVPLRMESFQEMEAAKPPL